MPAIGQLAGGLSSPALTPSQYSTEGQDKTARGGTMGAGSIGTGVGPTTTTSSAGLPLSTVIASGMQLSKSFGPLSPNYLCATGQTQTCEVLTNNGVAILSYTGISAGGLMTGIAITNGINPASTIATAPNNVVFFPTLPIFDLVGPGASILRGVGASALGVTDWATLANVVENAEAGLTPGQWGFVTPTYLDPFLAQYNWAVNTGAGVSAVTTGSPIITAGGGQYASSALLVGNATISDNRNFRRCWVIFRSPAAGAPDNLTITTTGVVRTSGTLTTIAPGQGLTVWDSGDLGYGNAGTGVSCQSTPNGGSGVVIVGVIYFQGGTTTGQGNGSVIVNISKGGTNSGDWAGTPTAYTNFINFFQNVLGVPFRRIFLGDSVGNDQLQGVSVSQSMSNLQTIVSALKTAAPLSELDLMAIYTVGNNTSPGVGDSAWGGVWVPSMRQIAIGNGCTFLDLWARFGDCSNVTGNPSGNPYQLTVSDGLHFGSNAWPYPTIGYGPSLSGRNSQQTIAEYVIEKLEFSRAFNLSGVSTYTDTGQTLATGVPAQIRSTSTQKCLVTLAIAAGGTTASIISMGPTAATMKTIAFVIFASGSVVSLVVPAGWWIEWQAGTGATTSIPLTITPF